mgnify:CR=1 FL=1
MLKVFSGPLEYGQNKFSYKLILTYKGKSGAIFYKQVKKNIVFINLFKRDKLVITNFLLNKFAWSGHLYFVS